MKILYFSQDYTTHDRRFLEALANTAHEVFFMNLERSKHAFEQRPLPEGVQVVSWFPGRFNYPKPIHMTDRITSEDYGPGIPGEFEGWDILKRFNRVLDRIKPDLVQAGPVQTCAFLAALAQFHPLVSVSWGSDLLVNADRDVMMRTVTRYVLDHSDALVGDCDPVRQKAEEFGMSNKKIITFPWGINLEQFEAQAYPTRSNGTFRILSSRSWEPIYGVDLIIKAFAQVVHLLSQRDEIIYSTDAAGDVIINKDSPVRDMTPELILLGNGSQASQLMELICEEKIDKYVILPGRIRQDELPALYGSADLYISASHSDGTSISLLEAMGSGRAVLVSDIPGNRQWITHEVEGWLFPDGDVQAIVNGILHAMDARDKLPNMGLAARKKAEQRADWQQNFPKLLEAYQIAIQNRK